MASVTAAGGPAAEVAASVAARLAEARQRISAAGADPASVTVVAVTKGFGPEMVAAAAAAGLADVGENYAQELLAKAAAATGVRWHLLGAPQRNKLAALAPVVHLWQAVDRRAVLEGLAARLPGAHVLVQVNVAADPAKQGCTPADAPGLVAAGRDLGLDVRGLMVVAPAASPSAARDCFARLAELGARVGTAELSMGMSDDYELAVAEGATTIRLGRALFGPRPGR